MWFWLLLDSKLDLLGTGKEGRKLRKEIKRLLEKPSYLPEETLLLDRDRYARKFFWIYSIAGMGALLATFICVQFIEDPFHGCHAGRRGVGAVKYLSGS